MITPKHAKETEINLSFTDDQVRSIGCIVCRRLYGVIVPPELHHIRKLSTSKKRKFAPIIPLCPRHHAEGGVYGEAIHAGHAEFEKNYGSEIGMLMETNAILIEEYGGQK